jgi:hypothetical protein
LVPDAGRSGLIHGSLAYPITDIAE